MQAFRAFCVLSLLVSISCGGGGAQSRDAELAVDQSGETNVTETALDGANEDTVDATGTVDVGGADVLVAETVCSVYATAQCNQQLKCSPFQISFIYGDVETCIRRRMPQCQSWLRAPGTGVTLAGFQACAALIPAITCADFLDGKRPSECRPRGSRPIGAACAVDYQCAGDDAHCSVMNAAPCGICRARMDDGSPCTSDGDCHPGSQCVGTTGGVLCAPAGGLGAVCDLTRPCTKALVCLQGVCAEPLEPGATCDPTNNSAVFRFECDTLRGVGKGRYCDPNTSQCVTTTAAGPGDDCSRPGRSLCRVGTTCQSTDHTCSANVPDGDACGAPNDFGGCALPSLCIGGICGLPDPTTCE
jgi:hypothetical protein